MNEAEAQQYRDRAAARQAVEAKMADPDARFEDDRDFAYMSPDEVSAQINAGKVPGIGPDRRLRR